MPTVHQADADNILKQLKVQSLVTGPAVRQQFDAVIPTWQISATGEKGYSDDQMSDTIICIARALHSALPAPFVLFPFDWRNQHGMNVNVVYVSQELTAQEIDLWLDGAISYNATAMANV